MKDMQRDMQRITKNSQHKYNKICEISTKNLCDCKIKPGPRSVTNAYLPNFAMVTTVDSRFFGPVLIQISGLFEEFFIPRGFSLRNSCKYLSVIRTCSYSNFRIFEVIFYSPWRKTSQLFEAFPKPLTYIV